MHGPVKIGCSYSPDLRRDTLETWSPFPLEIIAEIEGDTHLERRFHALFFDTFKSREWFGVSAEMLAVVAAINAGTFDIDTLPEGRKLPSRPSSRPKRKWSDQQRAATLRANELRRAERKSGLVLPYWVRTEKHDAFVANPSRETGGVTADELRAMCEENSANYHDELAAAARARAAKRLAAANRGEGIAA